MESPDDPPNVPGSEAAKRHVKRIGRDIGFDTVRIAAASPLLEEGKRYVQWVEAGRHGEMAWITAERARRSSCPAAVLPGARSVICVGLSYWAGRRPEPPGHGRVARYAWGRDYHQVMGEKLAAFAGSLEQAFGGEHRWHADTGPLMDKALAARAGLGWYGKNTNVLTESFGSFLFLGEIVTTLDLAPDLPIARDCGSCRLCAAACPTGALHDDYTIDATLCISYLTIEHRGAIARELRPQMGPWVFGCDICQDVCPPAMAPHLDSAADRRVWAAETRRTLRRESGSGVSAASREAKEPALDLPGVWRIGADHRSLDLLWMLRLTHPAYLEAFRGTAIRRAKVWMLRRNAAVALGNVGDDSAIEPLLESARADEHPVVRSHAAWALGRLAIRLERPEVAGQLESLLAVEEDPVVRDEIRAALRDARAPASLPL